MKLQSEGALSKLPKPEFFEQAACRHEDPELFFPVSHVGTANRKQIERARAVCDRCPVKADCLTYALDHGLTHGIWGGVTEQSRDPLHRNWQEATT